MAIALNKVQDFATIPGQSQPQLVTEHHYLRLKGEGADYPLYIQHGQVLAEAGEALDVDEIPEWFWTELEKCSPEALAAVGWQAPEPPKRR